MLAADGLALLDVPDGQVAHARDASHLQWLKLTDLEIALKSDRALDISQIERKRLLLCYVALALCRQEMVKAVVQRYKKQRRVHLMRGVESIAIHRPLCWSSI